MSYIPPTLSVGLAQSKGNQVSVNATQAQHFIDYDILLGDSPPKSPATGSEFYQNLVGTFNSLNSEVIAADRISERFMVEPEKVNAHDLMIALKKSQMSLDLTRSVIQKSLDSYNTLINLR